MVSTLQNVSAHFHRMCRSGYADAQGAMACLPSGPTPSRASMLSKLLGDGSPLLLLLSSCCGPNAAHLKLRSPEGATARPAGAPCRDWTVGLCCSILLNLMEELRSCGAGGNEQTAIQNVCRAASPSYRCSRLAMADERSGQRLLWNSQFSECDI